MIRDLFHRPNREEELYAEAQALVDDGLDLQFVLALYPDDADWLVALLDTGVVIGETFAEEEPSYYFEASLKNRFLDAGAERVRRPAVPVQGPVTVVPSGPSAVLRLQGMMAGTAVALMLGALGVVTFGVITAGDSVPGDWNYAFKMAGERVEYSLSSGDQRVNVQLQHVQARIREVNKLNEQGKVSPQVLEDLREELEEVDSLSRQQPLDRVQEASLRAIGEASSAVLNQVKEQRPDLADEADNVIAVAAGLGTVTTLEEPSPTPTPTPEPTATPTATPTPTPEPSATAEATGGMTVVAPPPADPTDEPSSVPEGEAQPE